MTSVGKKLTLNFSKGRLAKKKTDRVQDEFDLQDRRASLSANPSKSSSMTNLHLASNEAVLDHRDILELTQFVRNFSEAMYKLKEVFNFQNKSGVSGDDVRVQAHDKLGELLCQLGAMKKYPATLTSQVLMAAHDVITSIKRSSYEDVVSDRLEILDCVDRLALAFSTSVSELLMGDMDNTSKLSKSRSYDNLLLDQDHSFGEQPVHDKSNTSLMGADIDQSLLRIDQGVDISLNRAKLWSKYAKDIISYIDKRASMEVEYAKSVSKLANSVQQTITEDSFLPFQSIYVTALNHDINLASKSQAMFHMVQAQKFVEPLSVRRAEHEKIRKHLKDTWAKEIRRMHEAVANLKKSRNLYVTRHQEYDKAREGAQKAETESLAQSSGAAKIEKKRKQEEEAMHKAMEAETTYKSCVVEANNRQQELEKVKEKILAGIRELILESDKIMKMVTVGYFQLMQAASAPIPAQFQELCEISERYEPGSQYTEFVRRMPVPSVPSVPEPFVFEPYDSNTRQYEARKPSIQSSGSGSDIQAYGDESPMQHSHLLKVKSRSAGGDDGDTDSISGSSSKSTSPTSSPLPPHKKHSKDTSFADYTDGGMVSTELAVASFGGVVLSIPARTHIFRKLRTPTRCRQCDSYVYFQGAECEKCGISTHKKCLENLAYQCGHKQASHERRMTTFGVDFCVHVRETHTEVPYIITKCTEEIEERGLDLKGIYRVSGVKSKVEALCQSFETQSQEVDLSDQNPHVISNVLKLYLRQLPEPLLTFRLYPLVIQLAKDEQSRSLGQDEVVQRLAELIASLPKPIITSLGVLMGHLAKVKDNEGENQMTASNLGIVFGPTLLRPSDGASTLNSLIETPHQTRIVELLILNRQVIFKDTEKKEIKENKEKEAVSTESLSVSVGSESGTSPVSPGADKWPVPEIQESLLDELVKVEPRFQQARPPNPANVAVAEGMLNLPGSVEIGNPSTEQDQEPAQSLQEHACLTGGFDEVDELPEVVLPDESNSQHAQHTSLDTNAIVTIDKELDPATISSLPGEIHNFTEIEGDRGCRGDDTYGASRNNNQVQTTYKHGINTHETAGRSKSWDSTLSADHSTAFCRSANQNVWNVMSLEPSSSSQQVEVSAIPSHIEPISYSHDDHNVASNALPAHAQTSPQEGLSATPSKSVTTAQTTQPPPPPQQQPRRILSSQMLRPNLRFYSPHVNERQNKTNTLTPVLLTQPRVYSPQSQRKHPSPADLQRRHSLTTDTSVNIDTFQSTNSLFYSPPDLLSKTLPEGSPSLKLLSQTSNKVSKLMQGRDGLRYNSPSTSPSISPNMSPNNMSPKDSPRGSPMAHRKNNTVLSLSSNRKPRFV